MTDEERRQKIIGIQNILDVDLNRQKLLRDGIASSKTKAAWNALINPQGLVGGTWPWINARIDGDEIVIEPGIVTAFAGGEDKMDTGETKSGISTKDNPSFIGCALPMRRDSNPQLRGSPIPKLPWKTTVVFTDPKTGISVNTKLIEALCLSTYLSCSESYNHDGV
jgi:hypothetical protein